MVRENSDENSKKLSYIMIKIKQLMITPKQNTNNYSTYIQK